jgi:hypothetical protein
MEHNAGKMVILKLHERLEGKGLHTHFDNVFTSLSFAPENKITSASFL